MSENELFDGTSKGRASMTDNFGDVEDIGSEIDTQG